VRCAASKSGQSTAPVAWLPHATGCRLPRRRADGNKLTRQGGWGGGCRVSSLAMTSSPQRHVPGHWAASLLSELARQARRPGVDLRYDTNVITRPRPVTRPSPSPSSRSFWRLASGVWLGGRPRRQRLYYCVAATTGCWLLGTGYWLLGTCPVQHVPVCRLCTNAATSCAPTHPTACARHRGGEEVWAMPSARLSRSRARWPISAPCLRRPSFLPTCVPQA
jgi:hypothetical protein